MAITPWNTITSDFPRAGIVYAAITLHVSGAVSDYDVKENTYLFDKLTYGREIVIRSTGAISVKFNAVTNDPVDLFANEGINTSGLPVSNIFITSTGGESVVRVWMVGWN